MTSVLSDNFNRANSTTNLGTGWTAWRGTWGVSTNKGYVATGDAALTTNYAVRDAGVSTCVVSTVLTGTGNAGIVVRGDTINDFCLIEVLVASAFAPKIYKVVAGVSTVIATGASVTFAAGDILTVEVTPTTIVAKRNGAVIVSVTDSTNGSFTKQGLYSTATLSGVGSPRFDEFSIVTQGVMPSPYSSLMATLSASAFWKHDEIVGTTLADSAGSARNETTAGYPLLHQTSAIPGYTGPVVTMDGFDDAIAVADNAVFDAVDTQGIVYQRWLKMDAAGAGDVLYIIADKTGTSNANKQWGAWWDNRTSQGSPKRLRMQWGYDAAGIQLAMDWSGDAARDALIAGGLFTFVFHPNSIGYVYLDDELVASGPLFNYPSSAGNVGNARTLQIGHLSGPSVVFNGQMGPGALWNSQISQSTIETIWRSAQRLPGSTSASSVVEIVADTDYDSFPGHIKAPNGDLLVAYRKGTSHTAATSGQGIYQTRSTNGGTSWDAPTKIIANDASTQFMTAGMSVIGTTCYLVTWVRPLAGGASTPATAVRIYSSTDNGSTWTLASTVNLATPFPNGAYTEAKLILCNGYYYLGAYGYTSGTAGDTEAGIWRSTDLSTWTRVATFDDGINGFNEIDVQLIGLTLVAAIRHESSTSIYTSTSTDGTTWSTPVQARKFATGAPRLSPVGPRGRAYMTLRYYASGTGYLASIDEAGVVREVSNLSGTIMYGQAAMIDDRTISAAWSWEKSGSDADIQRRVWTLEGYDCEISLPAVIASADPVATAGIVSASFTPTPGALVFATSVNTGSTTANGQGSISSSHGDLTWTLVKHFGDGNTTGGLRIWRAQADSSPAGGTVTVTLDAAPTIQDLTIWEVTGHDPANPIAGVTADAFATTSLTNSATLTATPTVRDRVIGAVVNRNKSTAPTVGAGFSSVDSAAAATPSASYLIEHKSTTSTTVDVANLGTIWSALAGFIIKAPPVDEIYVWDGSSLATSAEADPYWWDGTALQPLDAHSVV